MDILGFENRKAGLEDGYPDAQAHTYIDLHKYHGHVIWT